MSTDQSTQREPAEPAQQDGPPTWRVWLLRILRVGGTLLAFVYVLTRVEVDPVLTAFGRASTAAFVGACAVTALNLVVGAFRWRMLLAAYGAPSSPSILLLARAYFAGFFYNNYLPGGVGGDLVRGVITRRSFGESGAAASLTVVLVERVLGLSGLLLLVSATATLHPLGAASESSAAGAGFDLGSQVIVYAAMGLVAAAGAVIAIAASRRLATVLPGKLGSLAASLPELKKPLPFGGALAISLITQAMVALTGWLLMQDISPIAVELMDAFVIVPLAMAAAYFPLSLGGVGVREGAFVVLCGAALGMAEADALAISLLLWSSQLIVGAIGGLTHLIAPVTADAK